MKTVDKYRSNHSFCIEGTALEDIAVIMRWVDTHADVTRVTAIAHEAHLTGYYTARVVARSAIWDVRLHVVASRVHIDDGVCIAGDANVALGT